MSLRFVLREKIKQRRKKILSDFLHDSVNLTFLNPSNLKWFKQIFQKFYDPDETDVKLTDSEILNVHVRTGIYGKKAFYINDKIPASIDRLSGSRRGSATKLSRALRCAIQSQINNFKEVFPLQKHHICPVTKKTLRGDAQVDHYNPPFHVLKTIWLRENQNPKVYFDNQVCNYVLKQPYLERWKQFHLENAQLRWVSKEGNKIAHHYTNE